MGIFFAWAVGEGILTYRWVKAKAPPPPGALLLVSGLFLGLAIMAEYQPARATATAFAYAVDLAVLLKVVGKDPTEFPGKTGTLTTGWPPLKIPATQIWPGGNTPASGATSPAGTSAASKAGAGASRSAEIIKVISELPGFGFIK